MAVSNPLLDVFAGGQMTDLPAFPGFFTGTELMEIVSPGNVNGINYAVTMQVLANYLIGLQATPTFVTSGAVYNSVAADARILVNKTIGSATSVVLAQSQVYLGPVLVKGLKGDEATNPITVTFSSGQLMDTLTQVVINNPFGYFWFNPLASGGWYDAAY